MHVSGNTILVAGGGSGIAVRFLCPGEKTAPAPRFSR
jgi:short-subunit dehydrogenase involved in D-alanine esterification of teichoic acids